MQDVDIMPCPRKAAFGEQSSSQLNSHLLRQSHWEVFQSTSLKGLAFICQAARKLRALKTCWVQTPPKFPSPTGMKTTAYWNKANGNTNKQAQAFINKHSLAKQSCLGSWEGAQGTQMLSFLNAPLTDRLVSRIPKEHVMFMAARSARQAAGFCPPHLGNKNMSGEHPPNISIN